MLVTELQSAAWLASRISDNTCNAKYENNVISLFKVQLSLYIYICMVIFSSLYSTKTFIIVLTNGQYLQVLSVRQ